MKYKLIKEYPGSPKLENIAVQDNAFKNCYIIPGTSTCDEWKIYDCEKYPEFWEKVVEKDYEILSLINIQIPSKPVIITKKENNLFSTIDTPGVKTLEFYDKYDYIKIHSVKRLSDGEIFTIGDITNYDIIKKIKVNNDSFCIITKDYDLWNKSKTIVNFCKQPIFKTEDGVDIFKNIDKYYTPIYIVDKALNIKYCEKDFSVKPSENVKYFSTKEKAEEYILMNKPCLSLNDVEFAIFKTNNAEEKRNKLKNLVKSKIKQSV